MDVNNPLKMVCIGIDPWFPRDFPQSGGFGSKAPRVRSAFAAACELGDLEDGRSAGWDSTACLDCHEKRTKRPERSTHGCKLSQGNHSKDPTSKNNMYICNYRSAIAFTCIEEFMMNAGYIFPRPMSDRD